VKDDWDIKAEDIDYNLIH